MRRRKIKEQDDSNSLVLGIVSFIIFFSLIVGSLYGQSIRRSDSLNFYNLYIRSGLLSRTEEFKRTIKVEAKEKTIPEMIVEYSDKYQVNPMLIECILFNESGFNPEAVGDSGKAVGISQFHYPTWKSFRQKMGESTQDLRKSPEEAIKTLSWAISQGLKYHWSPVKNGVCQ